MSREFPDRVNPWTAAEGKREFHGTIALSGMTRLEPLMASEGEPAAFSARFSMDYERRPIIELQVKAWLPMVCQVSLETYAQEVRRNSLLAVIETQAEQALLPDHYEAVMVTDRRLAIRDLVEDELLLGMPQFPRRPGLEPVAWSTVREDEKVSPGHPGANPFAALGRLVRKGSGDTEIETE